MLERSDSEVMIPWGSFEFIMYGGTLLSSYDAVRPEESSEGVESLVEMVQVNRNIYLVIDSDSKIDADGEVRDNSTFAEAKARMADQLSGLTASSRSCGLWYEAGDAEFPTVEAYLDQGSAEKLKNRSKVADAKLLEAHWRTTKRLEDFPGALEARVRDLASVLGQWA